MRSIIWTVSPYLLAVLLALLPSAPVWPAVQASDDVGNVVRLAQPARRIVSLAPHITELLYATGAGDLIVGVSEFSDFPEAARTIPRIGGGGGLDLEAIVALQPDLVIAWKSGNPDVQLRRLQALGLAVFISEPRTLQDIAHTLVTFGRLANREAEGRRQASEFTQRIDALKQRYAGRGYITMFYQIWHRPVMTVNGEHLISDVMRLCGGRNVFDALPALAPQIGIEAVLAANPAVMVAASDDETLPDWMEEWRRWPELDAVREDRLYAIPRDLLVRHTPRILDGAERLCRLLEAVRTDSRTDETD